jgi:hypothetical protein
MHHRWREQKALNCAHLDPQSSLCRLYTRGSTSYQRVDFPIEFARRLGNYIVVAPFRRRPLHYRAVDPLHLGPSQSNIADIANRSRGLLLFELARAWLGRASENVVGVVMYGFVVDQVLGINGLINLSNIVFLVAFSAGDVLKLRILALVGEGLTLPWYYFQDEKLWPPIFGGRRS